MTEPKAKQDSWVFEGTWSTPIPTAILFDRRITPGDKVVWMQMRASMTSKSDAIKPTYDYLTETCGVSRSAFARTVKALRLAGWMGVRRLSTKDYIEGNQYALYDIDQTDVTMVKPEAQAFVAECQLIPGRIGVLAASVAARFNMPVINLVLPAQAGKTGSSKLVLPANLGSSKLELPENSGSSNLELSDFSGSNKMLLPENQQLTVGSKLLLPRTRDVVSSSSTTTTADVRATRAYVWPQDFSELSQRTAMNNLAMLSEETAQQVLDELAAQLPRGTIKNATVYLRALIARALAGTFEYTDAGERIARARRNLANQVSVSSTMTAPQKSVPPVSQITRSAWNATLQQLREELGSDNVANWLHPLMLREQPDELILYASNDHVLSAVRETFMPRLKELFTGCHPHLRKVSTRIGDGQDMGGVA